MNSVAEIFPLIDEPANIFYSKLKNIFLYDIQVRPIIYNLNRVKRTIEFNLVGENHTIRMNYDARKINYFKNLIGKFVYLPLRFHSPSMLKKDTTSGGELVDVNVGRFKFNCINRDLPPDGFEKVLNLPFWFTEFDDKRVNEFNEIKIIQSNTHGKSGDLIIGLPLGIVNLDPKCGLYDISTIPYHYTDTSIFYEHDYSRYKDTHTSIYRPIIGRKLVIDESSPISNWYLYDIDSNYDEILIDSKDDSFVYSGIKRYPYHYGNTITHTNKLHLYYHCSETNIHSFILIDKFYPHFIYNDNNTLYRRIVLIHHNINRINKCLETGKPVPAGSIRPLDTEAKNNTLKVEYDILIDCYLTNINIRYYFLSVFDEAFRFNRFTNNENTFSYTDKEGYEYVVYPEIETLTPSRQGLEPVIWRNLNLTNTSGANEAYARFMERMRNMYNQTCDYNFVTFSENAYFYLNRPFKESDPDDPYIAHYVNAPVFNCLCFSMYCPIDKERKVHKEILDIGRLSRYVYYENKKHKRIIKCDPLTKMCANYKQAPMYVGGGDVNSKYNIKSKDFNYFMLNHKYLEDDTLTNYEFIVGYVEKHTPLKVGLTTLKDIYGKDIELEVENSKLHLFGLCLINENGLVIFDNQDDDNSFYNNHELNIYCENGHLMVSTNTQIEQNTIESFIIAYRVIG